MNEGIHSSILFICFLCFFFLQDFIILMQSYSMYDRQYCALNLPQKCDLKKKNFLRYTYILVKCIYFKYPVQWVLTNAYTHVTMVLTKAYTIWDTKCFYHPKKFHQPICGPFLQTLEIGKNWSAFCHYSFTFPGILQKLHCQASLVQPGVSENHPNCDVHQWFISLGWWVIIPFPSFTSCRESWSLPTTPGRMRPGDSIPNHAIYIYL